MLLTSVVIAGISYLIGSLPTAYLLVRWKTREDVRRMGSGNVGALNSYEVTRSKFVGISVLLVDLVKGVGAVLATRMAFGDSILFLGLSAVGVILGHNYPIWLKFHGGRGLAPAAGAVLVINWLFVAIWASTWLVTYMITKKIHTGNIIATVLTPLISALLSGVMVEWGIIQKPDVTFFIVLGFVLCTLLFLRHLGPFKEMLSGTGQ